MILSASRRTDIPAFYSDWFYERIKEGYFMVRNPFDTHQVSKVDIRKDNVDCIVFWSKNPAPMLDRLSGINDYNYYVQYTLNGCGYDIEPNLPTLKERIYTFCLLSRIVGKERVIWRYDPIMFTKKYDRKFHLECFEYLAARLKGYTTKCVFSFVDIYPSKNLKKMQSIGQYDLFDDELREFAGELAGIADRHELELSSCAEKMDLSGYGITHSSCIDQTLIEQLCGYKLDVRPDGQRVECRCIKCEDMGAYDTCLHGCLYCYANCNAAAVRKKAAGYDPRSPLLCGQLLPDDRVTERKVRSLRAEDPPEQLMLI